ncbi:MAG: hypothetical protein WCI57_05565 [Candidatus Berkelbacteria bacterium]
MAETSNEVRPDQFWLTKESKIVHILRLYNGAIRDCWIANIAGRDGTFEKEVKIYSYDLTERISVSEAESRLDIAQEIREKKARLLIAKFLK